MTQPSNAFIGWTKAPTERDLETALGAAKPVWDSLVGEMARELDIPNREWKSYGRKFGWALKLQRGKRTIVHLSPCAGSIAVAFILGDRAVKAARAGRLGARATKLLDEAPRYPEGTGIRLQVKHARDLPLVRKLAAIKIEN